MSVYQPKTAFWNNVVPFSVLIYSKYKSSNDHSPVNIFWKAVSTFVESKADVSINDKLFFSESKIKTVYINLNSISHQHDFLTNHFANKP